MVRGGSSPLERIEIPASCALFGVREDVPIGCHGGSWQPFGNTRPAGAVVAMFAVITRL
jgi:hypothetical protein